VRDLILTEKAHTAFDTLAPSGAPRTALAAVIAELMDNRVPLVRSDDLSVTHGSTIMGRRVPGTDLVVYYVPAGEQVFVVNIRRHPA
jgi:hypothetical protein